VRGRVCVGGRETAGSDKGCDNRVWDMGVTTGCDMFVKYCVCGTRYAKQARWRTWVSGGRGWVTSV
jgi:hypothetical protein